MDHLLFAIEARYLVHLIPRYQRRRRSGYFTEPDNQLDCIGCPPLCTDCLSTVHAMAALVMLNWWEITSTRYLNKCTECPDLCKTCGSEGLDEVC